MGKLGSFFSESEITHLAKKFEYKSPVEVLRWGLERFGDKIILACSLGAEDMVLIDMLSKLTSNPRVFYLDTDKHFKETLETRDRVQEKYNISILKVSTELSLEKQATLYGDNLWQLNPDLCCQIRKVQPLTNVLSEQDAWITGIRREQSPARTNAQAIEWDQKFELIKLNPLINWSHEQVWYYIRQFQVPYNPLHDQHYPSIGCSVCTRPVQFGEDIRSGRWSHTEKTECGLHNKRG